MDDEALSDLLRRDVGSKALDVIRQIDEIWQRNLRPMKDDQEECVRAIAELRKRHRKDAETIAQIRTQNESLTAELKTANQDKEIYAKSLRESKDHCASLEANLLKTIDERDAVLDNLQEREKQLSAAKQATESADAERVKLRAELRSVEDKLARLTSRYDHDVAEFQQRLTEQERSAGVRMEDQKKEIERRLLAECHAKLKKYDDAHYKMKQDFEAALRQASSETKTWALEAKKHRADAENLRAEREAFRERTRLDTQKLAAEKWHELVSQLGVPGGGVERKLEFAPRQPHFYADQFLEDLKNKHSDAAVSPTSSADNNGALESGDSSGENEPPPRKSHRRSTSAVPRKAQTLAPAVVFGRTRRNATGGSTTTNASTRNAGQKSSKLQCESRSARR